MIDLEPFRTAAAIRWVRATAFAPHRGDDGNLMTDEGHSIPLDTWLPGKILRRNPQTKVLDEVDRPSLTAEGGMAVVDPDTLADVHAAVVQWCREHLGRDDVTFDS